MKGDHKAGIVRSAVDCMVQRMVTSCDLLMASSCDLLTS